MKTRIRNLFVMDGSLSIAVKAALMSTVGVFFATSLLRGQVQEAWVARYNGEAGGGTNQAVAVALDTGGNVVVSGNSTSTNGDYDYLILKYSTTGSNLWTARYASQGISNDQVRAMVLDKDDNVYVTGTSVTAKFGNSGTLQWTAPYGGLALAVDTNAYCYVVGFQTNDFATVKLDDKGSNVWLRTYDKIGAPDVAQAVTLDAAGSVYVAGVVTWYSNRVGLYEQFGLLKYDPNGNELWNKAFPPLAQAFSELDRRSEVKGIVAGSDGAIYLSGNLRGFEGVYRASKITVDGIKLWDIPFVPNQQEGETAMACDDQYNTYMTGRRIRMGSVVYDTLKVNSGGSNMWESFYDPLQYHYHRANAIALDTNRNVCVTGYSGNPSINNDFATVKYDNDGHELWVHRYDGPAHGDDRATGIAVSPSGEIYVTGWSTTSSNLVELTTIRYAELRSIQVQSNSTVLLQFFGNPGQSYRFQATSDFPNWQDIGTSSANTSGVYSFVDTNAPAYPYRFYRTVSP